MNMKNLNEEVNKIKHFFNFKKGDVITESLLSESTDGGCKCPDGTVKPECCNTDAQKDYRRKKEEENRIYSPEEPNMFWEKGGKNVLDRKYFESNPKGTITFNYGVEEVNGSTTGIISPAGIPDFKELWTPDGMGGRGFNQGNGKFTYEYKPQVTTFQGKTDIIKITNAADNKEASCEEGSNDRCYFYLSWLGKEYE